MVPSVLTIPALFEKHCQAPHWKPDFNAVLIHREGIATGTFLQLRNSYLGRPTTRRSLLRWRNKTVKGSYQSSLLLGGATQGNKSRNTYEASWKLLLDG